MGGGNAEIAVKPQETERKDYIGEALSGVHGAKEKIGGNRVLIKSVSVIESFVEKLKEYDATIEKGGNSTEKLKHEDKVREICQLVNATSDLMRQNAITADPAGKEASYRQIVENISKIRAKVAEVKAEAQKIGTRNALPAPEDVLKKSEPLGADAQEEAVLVVEEKKEEIAPVVEAVPIAEVKEEPAVEEKKEEPLPIAEVKEEPALIVETAQVAEVKGEPVEVAEPAPQIIAATQMKADITQKFRDFAGEEGFKFFEEGNRLKSELNSLDEASLKAVWDLLVGMDVNRQYFTALEKLNNESKLESAKLALNLVKMLKENHGAVDAERLGIALDYIIQESVGSANYWAQIGGQCWAREIEILDALKKGTVSSNMDGRIIVAK